MKQESSLPNLASFVRPRIWRNCLLVPLFTLLLQGLLVSSGRAADNWILVTDPRDMADSSGDIRAISAYVRDGQLHLSMTVEKVAAPSLTEQTPVGMNNRYYYHWLLDTDNNPATGRSNSEYEGNPTGVVKPVGAEMAVMIGWRDGLPGGIEVFNALDDTILITTNFTYQASGNTLSCLIPLTDIGLIPGQTIAVSAYQEGSSDGWAVDWMESATLSLAGLNPPTILVKDKQDMADSSGDIRAIGAQVMGNKLYLSMTVEKVAAPSLTEQTPVGMNNRYYYHWLLDTDNNPATGRSNSEYEGNPTGVVKPVGAELAVMIGWRDGLPGGIEVFNALDDTILITTNFTYQASGNTLSCLIPLADIGLIPGQTIAVSAYQEGSSDGWAVDWMESATLTLTGPAVTAIRVTDRQDMADSSGDIRIIDTHVDEGTNLILGMTIEKVAAPSLTEQTPVGMNNRYYYHWLLDTDNNPATGRSNSEYEGNPTGVVKPVGAELAVMIGWRDGLPGGIEVFNALDDTILITTNFTYQARGNTLRAVIPLAKLGLTVGQIIAVSAYQEGSSDGWAVDWMESAVLTLEPPVSGGGGMTLATEFTADPVSFTILVLDSGATQVDTSSVVVKLDGGSPIAVTVTKTGGTNTITGRYPTLLPPSTVHIINLALVAGGTAMAKDFVQQVGPYTILPEAGALQQVNTSNKGFVANVTQITSAQTLVTSLHSNIAGLAEKQLAGQMKDETGTITYYNEASDDTTQWKINSEVLPGVVNWYELAPGVDASLNFTNDEAIPRMTFPGEGVVVEILTYVDLAAGYHQLGLYTEGGHKITAGFRTNDTVLSLLDNSVIADAVPSYFARNRLADVIAPKAGYYPIRVLWFQSKRDQEQGLMLELYSVANKQLHLMNSATDPVSLRAYRAGALINSATVTTPVAAQRSGNNLVVTYTGMLQWASGVQGPWHDYADGSQSPVTIAVAPGAKFFRSRSY